MTETFKKELISELSRLNDDVVKQIEGLSKISKKDFEEIKVSFEMSFEEIEYILEFFKREEESSEEEEESSEEEDCQFSK